MRLVDVYPYRIVEGQVQFLLLRRAAGVIYAGQWRMVGGKAVEGETHSAAALREFAEETGLAARSFWVVPTVNAFFDPAADQIRFIPAFAVECADGEPTLNQEHDAFGWFDLSETLPRLAWYEQRRIVGVVHDLLSTGTLLPEWFISV